MIELNEEQEAIKKAAVDWFYNKPEQVFQIAGAAGTGKTFLIFQILAALGLKNNEFLAMAYTGQASIVLRTRGFLDARSIHSSLYEMVEIDDSDNIHKVFNIPVKKKVFRKRNFIPSGIKLFFIDEAYMVPATMVKDILSFGIKVIACGDPNQLPPVQDVPGFLISGEVHRLTKLMRQSEEDPIVYIANRILNDLPVNCGVYGNNKTVLVTTDDQLTPEMFIYSDCVCCGTNKTRDYLNDYIRELKGFKGDLPMLYERVICRQNNWDQDIGGISLCNGLVGTVISPVDVSHVDSKTFCIDFKPDLLDWNYFEKLKCNKEYFTSSYDHRQSIKRLDSKYIIGELFEFAYALTTHLCQGSEYSQGMYIEEFMRYDTQKALNYTAVTRFKQKMIYVKKAG